MTELTRQSSVPLRKGVPPALILVLLLSEGIDAFAQYCFKRAAVGEGAPAHLNLQSGLLFAAHVATQGYLWLGVFAIAAVFINWSVILSKLDVSVAVPLTSVSYIFVALISVFFLHEHISATRWCGIALILIGVLLVARSSEPQEQS